MATLSCDDIQGLALQWDCIPNNAHVLKKDKYLFSQKQYNYFKFDHTKWHVAGFILFKFKVFHIICLFNFLMCIVIV